MDVKRNDHADVLVRPRRPYAAPQIVVWGDAVELTQGGQGGNVDDSLAPSKAI